MRISLSPFGHGYTNAPFASAPACRRGNVSASAKFPRERGLLPHHGLADAITPDQIFSVTNAARLLRSDGVTMEPPRNFDHFIKSNVSAQDSPSSPKSL
jgi:hypothetical protein